MTIFCYLLSKMNTIDKILSVAPPTANDICMAIANRVKQRRLDLNLTQLGLCNIAKINISSYRRFERTGKISIDSLIRIALATGKDEDFDALFATPIYKSIDDVLNTNKRHKRQRGIKNE